MTNTEKTDHFLRPFDELESEVYELEEGENRRYFCEKDYKLLYAPQCARCEEFIFGQVASYAQRDWHKECFTCENGACGKNLFDISFTKMNGRLMCMDCYNRELSNKENLDICQACQKVIHGRPLRFRGDP